MSKRGSLADVLKTEDLSHKKQKPVAADTAQVIRYISPCRKGKKSMTVWFDPDVIQQLKLIGIREGLSIQAMMTEAMNDFFSKHHKSRIAR
jgi:hypothetical protein